MTEGRCEDGNRSSVRGCSKPERAWLAVCSKGYRGWTAGTRTTRVKSRDGLRSGTEQTFLLL